MQYVLQDMVFVSVTKKTCYNYKPKHSNKSFACLNLIIRNFLSCALNFSMNPITNVRLCEYDSTQNDVGGNSLYSPYSPATMVKFERNADEKPLATIRIAFERDKAKDEDVANYLSQTFETSLGAKLYLYCRYVNNEPAVGDADLNAAPRLSAITSIKLYHDLSPDNIGAGWFRLLNPINPELTEEYGGVRICYKTVFSTEIYVLEESFAMLEQAAKRIGERSQYLTVRNKTRVKESITKLLVQINDPESKTVVREDRYCLLCFELERSVLLKPCFHIVCCLSCSKNLQKCPVCRTIIKSCDTFHWCWFCSTMKKMKFPLNILTWKISSTTMLEDRNTEDNPAVTILLCPATNGFPREFFAQNPAYAPPPKYSRTHMLRDAAAMPVPPAAPLHFVVWGGGVYNHGEDDVSKFLHFHRANLTSFTYFPEQTKGGVMVRPRYFVSDRAGRCEFPALLQLTMPLIAGVHGKSLWITPRLKTLTLLAEPQHVNDNAEWFQMCVGDWLNWTSDCTKVLADCPELDEIVIAEACAKETWQERKLRPLYHFRYDDRSAGSATTVST
jgi:hypothetical protein